MQSLQVAPILPKTKELEDTTKVWRSLNWWRHLVAKFVTYEKCHLVLNIITTVSANWWSNLQIKVDKSEINDITRVKESVVHIGPNSCITMKL